MATYLPADSLFSRPVEPLAPARSSTARSDSVPERPRAEPDQPFDGHLRRASAPSASPAQGGAAPAPPAQGGSRETATARSGDANSLSTGERRSSRAPSPGQEPDGAAADGGSLDDTTSSQPPDTLGLNGQDSIGANLNHATRSGSLVNGAIRGEAGEAGTGESEASETAAATGPLAGSRGRKKRPSGKESPGARVPGETPPEATATESSGVSDPSAAARISAVAADATRATNAVDAQPKSNPTVAPNSASATAAGGTSEQAAAATLIDQPEGAGGVVVDPLHAPNANAIAAVDNSSTGVDSGRNVATSAAAQRGANDPAAVIVDAQASFEAAAPIAGLGPATVAADKTTSRENGEASDGRRGRREAAAKAKTTLRDVAAAQTDEPASGRESPAAGSAASGAASADSTLPLPSNGAHSLSGSGAELGAAPAASGPAAQHAAHEPSGWTGPAPAGTEPVPARAAGGTAPDAPAAGTSAASRPLNEIERVRFVQRVSRAFQTALDRGAPLRLRLAPPELGALRLEVVIRDGALSARLEAENASAQAVLLEHLPALRDRLQEQNIRVERFDIGLLGQSAGEPREQQHRQAARQPGPAGPARGLSAAEAEAPSSRSAAAGLASSGRLNVIV